MHLDTQIEVLYPDTPGGWLGDTGSTSPGQVWLSALKHCNRDTTLRATGPEDRNGQESGKLREGKAPLSRDSLFHKGACV